MFINSLLTLQLIWLTTVHNLVNVNMHAMGQNRYIMQNVTLPWKLHYYIVALIYTQKNEKDVINTI
jgi:hypothetical protein